MTSTYSLLVTETSPDQPYKTLEDGYDENGEILGNNIQTYVYKVPALEY
jgi:hypothetical protein